MTKELDDKREEEEETTGILDFATVDDEDDVVDAESSFVMYLL